MNTTPKPKLLVITGPTASGKSDLAVRLALWIAENKIGGFTGAEIISADSRQVYTGLDIGTGKITTAEMQGVPHHLLDAASPHDRMTAIDWKVLAKKSIADIIARGNLPLICGGTGFYISTLVDDLGFPDVEADTDEQKELEAKTVDELFLELKKCDPARSSTIDPKNKRRLARAIIVARKLGAVPPVTKPEDPTYDTLMIGTKLPDDELKSRIRSRLISRLDAGMIAEAERVHAAPPEGLGLSFERMDELGLEYRYLGYFLQKQLTQEELIERLSSKIWQYAKRQMTWFKKDTRIRWFAPTALDEVEKEVVKFLQS